MPAVPLTPPQLVLLRMLKAWGTKPLVRSAADVSLVALERRGMVAHRFDRLPRGIVLRTGQAAWSITDAGRARLAEEPA